MNLRYGRIQQTFYFAIGCIIILAITLFHLPQLTTIYVVPDEFGYWTAASFFCGYDWSSVASLNPYYSYGYGFLLAPLLKFASNSALSYQLAIIMNSIFLCLSFLISIHCLHKMFPMLRLEWITLISLATSLYANNVAQAPTTMSECLLFLLFWCVFFCYLHLCETGRTLWLILFLLFLIASYFVHMRAIGILIAGIIMLSFLYYKKIITWKQCVLASLLLVCLFVLGSWLKDYFQASVYTQGDIAKANDFSGQVGKMKSLFTWQGLKNLIKSVSGKVWYLFSASLLLVPWFVVIAIKKIRFGRLLSKHEDSSEDSVFIFLLLCLLGQLGISCIFMLEPTRIDTLFYGRYNEFIFGPVLGIALCWLLSLKKFPWKESFLLIFLYVMLSMLTHFFLIRLMYSNMLTGAVYTHVAGLFQYIWKRDISIFSISMKCLALMFVPLLLLAAKIEWKYMVKPLKCISQIMILLLFAGVWIWNGLGYTHADLRDYHLKHTDSVIATIVENADIGKDVPVYYIYYPDDSRYIKNRIFTVQFALKDRSITVVNDESFSVGNYEENALFIVNKDSAKVDQILTGYNVIFQGNHLELFTSSDNPDLDELCNAAAAIIDTSSNG